MPYRDLSRWNEFLELLKTFIPSIYFAFIALFAATATTVQRVRDQKIERFTIKEWLGDIVISGFVGLMTFYLCVYASSPEPLTAVFVGIASHMGTRALRIMQCVVVQKSKQYFGVKDDTNR